jgi:hypothetical protein
LKAAGMTAGIGQDYLECRIAFEGLEQRIRTQFKIGLRWEAMVNGAGE